MKKITMVVGAIALASAFAAPTFAADKIAVVDMQKLLSTSDSAKKIGEDLRSKFSDQQKDIANLQKSLQAEAAKLKKGTSTMSAKQLADAKIKLNKDTVTLQQKQAQFFQDVGVERNKAMEDFYVKLQGVVGDLAKKDGYTLVLPKRLTLYSDSSQDVTDQVQKELD